MRLCNVTVEEKEGLIKERLRWAGFGGGGGGVSWCCGNHCWFRRFDVGIIHCLSNLLYYVIW